MTGGMNFWDVSVWSFVVTLAILLGGMLLANALRRKVPFIRRSLIPSSVLGGFIVLFVDKIFEAAFGYPIFKPAILETLTYHGLGLGFVALAWRSIDRTKGKKAKTDIFNTSTVVVGSYLIQGIVGLVITIILFYLIGSYAAAGVLLPMGFGQGPGQAYNWGHIFQSYTDYAAFDNGASFGLTVAALGFVSASLGGVFFLNRMKKKGDPRAQIQNAEQIEELSAEKITGKGEIPISESMDKLTVQFGLIFVTYALTFAAMYGITILLDNAGGFFVSTVKPLIWGFNFLIGTAMAILFRNILAFFRRKGIMTREYSNNFMLNRISGTMFDIMVTASIASIDLSAFRQKEFVLPLILICAAGAFITYWYNLRVCRFLFPEYKEEAFLSMYGMLTGTASTGVILLREIDPLFETPAANNLIYQNLWSIILGAPMLLLMGMVARSMTWTWLTLAILVGLLAIILILQFRSILFKKKKK